MINRLLVKKRLSMIEEFCRELELLKELTREEFLVKRNTAAAESFLRRSLEAAFDLGRHILAKNGHLEMSSEYKSIAKGLVKINAIDEQLGKVLVEMAGYRNRLVHLYHEISEEELYQIIHNNLGDFYQFIKQINGYVDSIS